MYVSRQSVCSIAYYVVFASLRSLPSLSRVGLPVRADATSLPPLLLLKLPDTDRTNELRSSLAIVLLRREKGKERERDDDGKRRERAEQNYDAIHVDTAKSRDNINVLLLCRYTHFPAKIIGQTKALNLLM